MSEFVSLVSKKADSKNSWKLSFADINNETWDLSVNNPNKVEEIDNRTPKEIFKEIKELDVQIADTVKTIKELL